MLKYSHPDLALLTHYWPLMVSLATVTHFWDQRDDEARRSPDPSPEP